MKVYDVADMVEAFLKASGRNYSSRAIARGIAEDPRIEEPPSPRAVLRALHISKETRGTVVRNQFLRGGEWCHRDHYREILEEKRSMEAVRRGGTTRTEDRLARNMRRFVRFARTRLLGRIYRRWFLQGKEIPESLLKSWTESAVWIFGSFFRSWDDTQKDLERLDQAWKSFDRVEQKPE